MTAMEFDSPSREALLDREIDKLLAKIVAGTASAQDRARYRDAVATRSSWMIGLSHRERSLAARRFGT